MTPPRPSAPIPADPASDAPPDGAAATTGRPAATRAEPGRAAIAMAGLVALAVAMGIGRFAFTPLLPMMLADGVIDLHAASWLASANYLGYLAGAVLCTLQPWLWARLPGRLPPPDAPRLVRAGLAATAALTLLMALPWPASWPALRFAAGVASAVVLVYSAGWCLAQLARRDAIALGGVMFAGPGAGIIVSGLFAGAMVAWHWRAATAWIVFAALAAALSAAVWHVFVPTAARRGAAAPAAPAGVAASPHGRIEVGWLALGYGLAGFGYIVTATFLPVIARAALPGSAWLDLFWPIFGAGVVVGALLASRLRYRGDLRALLAAGYVVQAVGIAIGLWRPSPAGFALGSLLLGLPFTAITFFAMQEVRRLRPASASSFIGLLTAVYGIGQIGGPALVALLLRRSADASRGFALALEIALAALLLGAALFVATMRAWPLRRAAAPA